MDAVVPMGFLAVGKSGLNGVALLNHIVVVAVVEGTVEEVGVEG